MTAFIAASNNSSASPPHAERAEGDDRRAKAAVTLLVWAQAVLGAQMPVHFILGGLAGAVLAEDVRFATLPISMTVGATMLAAPVMAALMARWGRRTGFLIGALAGAAGGALAAEAIIAKDFALFCAASALLGVYMSAHNFYRFAAADLASPGFRPKAISWVLGGGLVAALLGPQIVVWFADALEPIPYAGAYRALVLLNLLGALPLLALDIPRPARRAEGGKGRSWRALLRDRRIVVAMLCAMVTYALMNLVMTSTPLAMLGCGFDTGKAAGVVQIHVVAMFLPSFFTGGFIARFGAPKVIAVGLGLLGAGGAVATAGVALENFQIALALLGLGWNFAFLGATAMLAASHRPEEAARVQGLNDFLVMGCVTVASLSSGALMATIGWQAVNIAMLPALTLAAAALIWLVLTDPARAA